MEKKYSTLEEVLLAREERAKEQQRLIDLYRLPLISFTLNIPGSYKNSEKFTMVHKEGFNIIVRAVKAENIEIVFKEEREASAGREAFVCCSCSGIILKKIMLQIEDEHPLGRLFDIDVFNEEGIQLNRGSILSVRRKCLICEEEAAVCVRSRAHNMDELYRKIEDMIDSYFIGGGKNE